MRKPINPKRSAYNVTAYFKDGHRQNFQALNYNAAHAARHNFETQYKGRLDRVEIVDKRGVLIWPRSQRFNMEGK